MKHLLRLLAGVVAIAVLVYHFSPEENVWYVNPMRTMEYEEGRPDRKEGGAQSRAAWELMRLADPATGEIPFAIRRMELRYARTLPSSMYKTTGMVPVDFVQRGPNNVGGRTRAIGIDVRNGSIIIAGGVSGGVWRTTNEGTSWSRVPNGNDNQSITCIAQDLRPGKRDNWYYGGGERLGNSASKTGAFYVGNGIYASANNGTSFSQLPSTATTSPLFELGSFDIVNSLIVDYKAPTNQDVLLAAVYGGIKRGVRNSGQADFTWTEVYGNGFTAGQYTEIAQDTLNKVYYATVSSEGTTPGGIFRSTDGITWTNITPAFMPARWGRTVIGIAPSNPNVVYFMVYDFDGGGTNDAHFFKYTYVSGNGAGAGGTWVNRTANLPTASNFTGVSSSVSGLELQGSYNMIVRVKPDNENVVYLGGTNLYRSNDGFATPISNEGWVGGYSKFVNFIDLYPNQHPDQHALEFFPGNPNKMVTGSDGGISVATNAGGIADEGFWSYRSFGYVTGQFYTTAIDPAPTSASAASARLVLGGLQDNSTYSTAEAGPLTNWQDVGGGDGAFCAVAPQAQFGIISTQGANLFRYIPNLTTGSGDSYVQVHNPNLKPGTFLFINPFAMDPNDANTIYMAYKDSLGINTGVRTANPVVRWATIPGSKLPTATAPNNVTAVAVAKTPANIVFYGSNRGRLFRVNNAKDASPTISEIGGGLPTANINCIAVDPRDANKVIVVMSNYRVQSLFYTENALSGAPLWRAISGNLEEDGNVLGNGPSTRWVSILPLSNGNTRYFCGTSVGLFSTNNLSGTPTWVREGEGTIGTAIVDMVVTREIDRAVIVATHGNGLYSGFAADDTTGGSVVTPIANGIKAGEVRVGPNPLYASSNKQVYYNLAQAASNVDVEIFNTSGQSVGSYRLGARPAGEQSSPLPVGNLESGVYIVRLTTNNGTRATGRFLVVK